MRRAVAVAHAVVRVAGRVDHFDVAGVQLPGGRTEVHVRRHRVCKIRLHAGVTAQLRIEPFRDADQPNVDFVAVAQVAVGDPAEVGATA